MENILASLKIIIYVLIVVLIVNYIIKSKCELEKYSFKELNLKVYTVAFYKKIIESCIKLIFAIILISVLIFIFKLKDEEYIKQNLNIIKLYFSSNITTFNTVLGAFLATISGFLLHFYTNIKTNRSKIRISCEALYIEIKCVYRKLECMLSLINAEDDEEFKKNISTVEKINYYSEWRKYYYTISMKLDSRYYEVIEELFTIVENFNIALQEEDIIKMRKTFINFRFWSSESSTAGDYYKIKPSKLLKNLNKYRKKPKINYDNLLGKILIEKKVISFANKKSDVIENRIIEIMKQTGEDNYARINAIVADWLKANDKEFLFLSKKICERIIRESSSNFKSIEFLWDSYGFKNNDIKE